MRSRPSRGVAWYSVAVAALLLLVGAPASGAEGSETCGTTGPLVCISASDTPDTVSPSTAGSPRYVSYLVEVSNRANSTVTHMTVDAALPAGLGVVSVKSSVGTCGTVGGHPSCDLGSLASEAHATMEVVVTAPTVEGSLVGTFTASFDEGPKDNPSHDPKQDTVSTTEETSVAAISGVASSFVPQGATVELSTEPTGTGVATPADPQFIDATITSAPSSVTASLAEVHGPLSCPKGVICRGGDWMQATIPGTFDPPLSFALRWDKSLIPGGLNAKKFVVLVTECLDGCPIEVVSRRCSSATPAPSELPCLWNIARLRDGDWVATLLNSHNGYMH